MVRSPVVASLVMLGSTLGSGLACGGAQPLGKAVPRAEAALPGMDEPSGSIDSSAVDPDAAAWQAMEEPQYVLTIRAITTGDIYHSFLVAVPDIGPGARYDLERAVEIDTDTPAFGSRGKPYVYVASASAPTVQRWSLKADGSTEPGPELSFEELGMRRADAAGSLSFYADDKAYFCNQFDPSGIAIWNPQTMTLLGTIPLELPADRRMKPQVVLSQRADRLFAIASWQQSFSGDWTQFGDHVQVVSIDPANDTVIGRADEPRCNSLSWVSTASDGTAYLSAAAYYAPLRTLLGAPSGVESCALRIMPSADSFEPGYDLDLASLTGGRPAGDLFLVSDTTAFLRVWHSELVTPLSPGNANWEAVLQEPGFLWWSWRLGSAEAQQVPDQQPSGEAVTFVVDGKTYTPTLSSDQSSVLHELDPTQGVLRAGLSGPGHIVGVFRAR